MSPTRFSRRAAGWVASCTVVLLSGCQVTAGGGAASSAPRTLAWFAAQPAPVGWPAVELPDRSASLFYPPTAHQFPSDAGAVTAASSGHHGEPGLYLNATPQQGSEALSTWARFRVEHLTDDNASSAALDASAVGLRFRGGVGSCVIDDYVTRIGAHHYREIACLVAGKQQPSVIIAAAPAAGWDGARNVLERAVEAYAVR